jgi:RNA polymerase subunit RPABC4/transcription elongation factor Spt4
MYACEALYCVNCEAISNTTGACPACGAEDDLQPVNTWLDREHEEISAA